MYGKICYNTIMYTKIAFIDDGINKDFIRPGILFENYDANEANVIKASPVNDVSHGTMCYQIFDNNVHAPYKLISIKVLDNTTGTGNHKALVSALNWCASQNIDIINMSMGTRQFIDFETIAKAISRLKNTVIVAACSNSNNLTFPACLPDVIGVRHCNREELCGTYAYLDNPYDQIEIMTCAKDLPISFGDDITVLMGGTNSFATPLITARIFEWVTNRRDDVKSIRNILKGEAKKSCEIATYEHYKGLLSTWEDVNIPLILLPNLDPETTDKLRALINIFIQDGYRAIALSQSPEACALDFVYNLKWNGTGRVSPSEVIKLYNNFAMPDIMFLQMKPDDAITLPECMQTDIVLKPSINCDWQFAHLEDEYVLDFTLPTKELFLLITQLLS